MKYIEGAYKGLSLLQACSRGRVLVFIFLLSGAAAISGCDFINQVANLGNSVGDMVGKGIGGG